MKNIFRNLLIIGCLISASNYRLYAQNVEYGFIQQDLVDSLKLRLQWAAQHPDSILLYGPLDSSTVDIWTVPVQTGYPKHVKLGGSIISYDFTITKPALNQTVTIKALVTAYRRTFSTASDTLNWQYTTLPSELFALIIKPDSILTTPETQSRACAIVMFTSNGQYALRNPEKNVTLCQTEYSKISSIYRNPTTNQQAIADTVKVVWSYSGGSITQEN